MSKINYLAATGAALVLATSFATTAFAWHPEGKITKEVQNVTLNGAYADANDAATAVTARPGDVLRYRMTVVNPAPAADRQYNDLTKIKVTDTLPAGVALASGSKDKDFGATVVVPQATKNGGTKSVSYEFTVKVASTVADKTVICNTATFNGNSVNNDAPRSGSDKACVKVTVPETPKSQTPKTPETPKVETPTGGQGEVLPAAIPATGAGSAVLGLGGLTAATYAAALFFQNRRK